MMNKPEKYLAEEEDGLIVRESQPHSLYKLRALAEYIARANNAMKDKPWRDRYFIDLLAGPGKNRIGSAIALGSPLIALTAAHPFTQYRLNEKDPECHSALQTRLKEHPLRERITIFQKDANLIVKDICGEIVSCDKEFIQGQWSTLNLAFLDPEGLELNWATVEQLATINRMDLIINFSTGGINRALGAGNLDAVDRFFGTSDWRTLTKTSAHATTRRRAWIDFYRKRLEQFGYHIDIDPDWRGADMAVKNSKNVQVYSMIFASKHELGDKFWNQAFRDAQPPRLPGF